MGFHINEPHLKVPILVQRFYNTFTTFFKENIQLCSNMIKNWKLQIRGKQFSLKRKASFESYNIAIALL